MKGTKTVSIHTLRRLGRGHLGIWSVEVNDLSEKVYVVFNIMGFIKDSVRLWNVMRLSTRDTQSLCVVSSSGVTMVYNTNRHVPLVRCLIIKRRAAITPSIHASHAVQNHGSSSYHNFKAILFKKINLVKIQ